LEKWWFDGQTKFNMKKIILGIAAVVVVAVAGALIYLFLNLNLIVKKGVETVGPQITKTEVKLDGASLSPFSGSGSLKGLLVGNPEGYKTPSALKLGEVSVAVSLSSLKSDTIVVDKVAIVAPEITFEGGLTGNNLKKIQANVEAAVGSSKTSDSGKKILVKDLTISGAKVNLSFTGLGGKSITMPLPDIHLQNLGTADKGLTSAELTKQVLGEMIGNVDKVAAKAFAEVGKLGKEAVNTAAEQLDKTTKGIKGLFGK